VSKILKNLPDQELASALSKNLEKRWATWEQPLILISFLLHPKYRDTFFSSNALSYVQLGRWILYYYKAWFGESPRHILFELSEFSEGQYPYDEETYSQFNNDILQFWKYARSHTKELYKVAQRVFSITVNTASIERIFSIMGWLHSPRRNRLKVIKSWETNISF
jgi:hypothetical protein